jgi:hypothetical protein
MTGIDDEQAAEILWASSDDGKAQLRAAWQRAMQLGMLSRTGTGLQNVTMSDVGALLWAARQAAVPEENPVRTVLAGCMYCHKIITRGRDADPWRSLPDKATGTGVLFPLDSLTCAASPDGRHHPPGPDGPGQLYDPPGSESALRHLGEM